MAADKIVAKLNNKTNGWFSIALYVLVGVAIVTVIWQIYKATKTGSKALGDTLGSLAVQNQLGITPQRQMYLKQAAEDAANACTKWWIGGQISISDDAFIAALNKVANTNEAALVSQYFREIKGYTIRECIATGLIADTNRITFKQSFN